jgi:hypothetical protein
LAPTPGNGKGIFPLATDAIMPGHSICIAILATIPAMPGERPGFPDNCDAIDASVAPGFTSIGQIDCPIPVSELVTEPVGGSACAGAVAPAVRTPTVTTSGRSTAEAALLRIIRAAGGRTRASRRTLWSIPLPYIISAVIHLLGDREVHEALVSLS